MKTNKTNLIILFVFPFFLYNCDNAEVIKPIDINTETLDEYEYFVQNPNLYYTKKTRLNTKISESHESKLNQITSLGRFLFYDHKLSKNNAIACASCHKQTKAFSDGEQFSRGLHDKLTTRNSMALGNTGFHQRFFWDVNTSKLQEAVQKPIQNHLEMGIEDISNLPVKLEQSSFYPKLFQHAFDSVKIDEEMISTALSYFISSMYSHNSKWDKHFENKYEYTIKEKNGEELFNGKAKCSKCHYEPYFTNSWLGANIGLDKIYKDEGAGEGRFKIPSLRNIELTAPYMHDGRFNTIEEVINHYDHGIKNNEHLHYFLTERGTFWDQDNPPQKLNLTNEEKEDLIAFLKTLTDFDFIQDPKYSNPFR